MKKKPAQETERAFSLFTSRVDEKCPRLLFPGAFLLVATLPLFLHKQAFDRQVPLAGIVAEGEDAAALGHIGQLFGNGGQRCACPGQRTAQGFLDFQQRIQCI